MKLPSVSVVIPLYNYEEYVCDAVYSCFAQKYPGLEVIVVDDGSTDDGVLKLTRQEACKGCTIIRHKGNRGYSVAKNTGIRASTGELIVLLDADDMLTPGSLEVRATYLAEHPEVDMVYGTAYTIHDEGGYGYYCDRIHKLHVQDGRKIHAQTTMLRRSVHLTYGLYDERLKSRSDNEMWNRLNLYGHNPGEPKIVAHRIDEPPFAFYRRHPKSMIEKRKRNPIYNRDVSIALEDAKQMRLEQGIHKGNTPWLDK